MEGKEVIPSHNRGLLVFGNQGSGGAVHGYSTLYIGKSLSVPHEDIDNPLDKYPHISGFSRNAQ